MKHIVTALTLVLLLSACNQAKKSGTDSNEPNDKTEIFAITALLEKAPELIDKDIKVTGTVNHVCSHSGRRCFLIDSIADETIKIEAAGEIESFDKELVGSDLVVSGVLKERRLMATEIDEWETKLEEKYGDIENGGEQCATEMADINSKREWMKEHGKDYYATYYVDGLSYEIVEQ